MRSFLLFAALALGSAWARAADPTTDCRGCTTLREFGNFGAAQLYRAIGAYAPMVGSDRIWVTNPTTGASVFVDVDIPIIVVSILGAPLPIPDMTRTEVNATWRDGSATETWILPNEVIGAMGDSIEEEEADETPTVTEEELTRLPGFSGGHSWYFTGQWGGLGSGSLFYGPWSYTVRFDTIGVPRVTIYECNSTGC